MDINKPSPGFFGVLIRIFPTHALLLTAFAVCTFASDLKGKEILKNTVSLNAIDKETKKTREPAYFFEVQVSGTVNDENGQPLPGANILEKGTTNGTTSDVNGNFSLTVMGESSVLIFSFIGYTSQEVPVGNKTTFDIQLQPDLRTLNEVVVVGYGTVRKSDLTGSVSSVKGEELTA